MFGLFKKKDKNPTKQNKQVADKEQASPKSSKSLEKTPDVKKEEPKTISKAKTTTKSSPKQVSKQSKPKAESVKTKEENNSSSTSLKGKFVYYKTAKGYFNYRLKAHNNETIAVSGGTGYASLTGCKTGIESVRKNINAPIEDQTVKNSVSLNNPKFVIFMDKAGKYRYRLFARNGELICTPEDGYASKDGCKRGIQSLAKWAINSDIVSEE